MWNQQDGLDKLFDFVTAEVWASGGDGDGVVVFRSQSINDVATAFEVWQSKHPIMNRIPYHRHNLNEGHVLFSDNSNENITFMSKKASETQVHPDWVDVKLEVW